jgi:peptidoglycan-associated lipoprotein
MKMRACIAILAVSAGVSGCAGTASRSAGESTSQVPDAGSGATVGVLSDGRVSGDVLVARVEAPSPGGGDLGLNLRQSVYYEFDRYDVKPEYRVLVEQHAAWLRANPGARLVISGNTDERGPSEYNLALGQRRAESVTRLLRMLGAREDQIEAVSFGKEKPRAAGHDEAAWAQNRRSDFTPPPR